MARYTGAVCRMCRREGQKLFLKGSKCYSEHCPFVARGYAPGQHGQNRKKVSEYGMQLRAKQTTKRYYGVLENQFAHYFDIAERKPGQTGENLLRLLECRLDNVVYRLGWATSRAEARQLVRHNHFKLNGKKVNIPSLLVKEGDEITLTDKSRQSEKFKAIDEACGSRPVPMRLESNREQYTGKVVRMPNRDDIDLEVEEHLIVELYSK